MALAALAALAAPARLWAKGRLPRLNSRLASPDMGQADTAMAVPSVLRGRLNSARFLSRATRPLRSLRRAHTFHLKMLPHRSPARAHSSLLKDIMTGDRAGQWARVVLRPQRPLRL